MGLKSIVDTLKLNPYIRVGGYNQIQSMCLTSQNDCKIVCCIRIRVCASRSSRQASHGTFARSDGVLLTIREGGASSLGPAWYLAKADWYFFQFQADFLLFGLCAALGLISSWLCWGCSDSLYYSWIVAVAPCGT